MHEHGSEERQKISGGIGKEAARHESPFPDKSVTATLLDEKQQDVQSDQGIRHQRNSSAGGIIITDWEHRSYLCLLWLRSGRDESRTNRTKPTRSQTTSSEGPASECPCR
jgi:hypothetical protein